MKEHDFISFDIFDTLITRTTATPRGIFAIMQYVLRTASGFASVPVFVKENFYNIRVESELFIRRFSLNHGINEVNFDEIYNHIQLNYNISNLDIENLKSLELETEIKNSLAIPANISKLKNYKKGGKKIVLISDMYHSSQTLRRILMHVDPVFVDIPIYVSSEARETKGNGFLYKYVREHEQNDIRSWLHIGDNMRLDVEVPQSMGVSAQHFRYCGFYHYERILMDKHPEDVYCQLAVGTARNVRLFCRQNEKFNLGCDMGGVVLFPLVNWIVDQAEKRNIKKLYFVMRDGYTLKKLCDILIAERGVDIRTKLIYGSREAWRTPAISKENSDLQFMFASPREVNTIEKIASRFHIKQSDLIAYLPNKFKRKNKIFTKEELKELCDFLSGDETFIDLVISANKERRDYLIEYIKQEFDLSDGHIAMVDLAASGRTQNCLAQVIRQIKDVKISSFYSQFNSLKMLNSDIDMFAFYSSPRLFSQIELFCRCMSGATIAYRKENDKIVPVLDEVEGEKLKEYNYEDVLRGEEAFLLEFCKIIKINKGIIPNLKAITTYFDYVLGRADIRLAEIIGEIPFSNYYGTKEKSYKCAPILTLRDILFGYDATQIQLPNLSYIRSSKIVRKIMDIRKKYGSVRKFIFSLKYDKSKKNLYTNFMGMRMGIPIPLRGLKEILFDKLLGYLQRYEFDDVYIFRMNAIGDAYMLCFMLDDWIHRNHSKKPIIVCSSERVREVFELLRPDLKVVVASFSTLDVIEIFWNDILNAGLRYKDHRWFSFMNKRLLTSLHTRLRSKFKDKERGIDVSFFLNLAKDYGDVEDSWFEPSEMMGKSEDITNYSKYRSLGTGNFVFMSPECSSCVPCDAKFWSQLIREIKSRGYGVFVNSKKKIWKELDVIYGCPDLKTTYVLASKAKSIVAMRSGLCDFLSTVNVPQHIIYTKFRVDAVQSSDECREIFSLRHLPQVNRRKIHEYSVDEEKTDGILNSILKELWS